MTYPPGSPADLVAAALAIARERALTSDEYLDARQSLRAIAPPPSKPRAGIAPYGYRFEGKGRGATVVEVEHEQAVLAFIFGQAANGFSLRAIASMLATAGYRPRTGSAFNPTTIARILKRERGRGRTQQREASP